MFFMFDMQEEWTWNISNNHIIKSDVYIKLKYIWIFLDIYQHMRRIKKKEENNILTMKHTKWKYLTCIKVSISNQNLRNDNTQAVDVNDSCIIIHNYKTHLNDFWL